MENEETLTEEESLRLITEMIHKAKGSFHESGTGAILWGSVVGMAGLISFAENYGKFSIGFDIWWIVLAAFIPQIIITIREKQQKKAVARSEDAMNAIWLVFGISIFMLNFYANIVPGASERIFAAEGSELLIRNLKTGVTEHFQPYVFSRFSLLLLLYAMPTLATGIIHKFKPMVWGGVLCYGYFLISCFTNSTYDLLLNGIAGITCWLIPGLILKFRKPKGENC